VIAGLVVTASAAAEGPKKPARARVERDASAAVDAASAAAPAAAPAQDNRAQLEAVLAKLAKVEALSARFHEEKRMALLAAPLESDGTLHYQRPRLLVRHTERPRKASLLLENDVLTFGDAQRKESVELSSQPALRVLVDAFVSVLAGDLPALEKVAELSVEPLEGAFRIRMVPKDPKMKRLVRAMSFEGALREAGAVLSRMELTDASGDVTVTTFSQVAFRKAFGEAERKRLFRMGG